MTSAQIARNLRNAITASAAEAKKLNELATSSDENFAAYSRDAASLAGKHAGMCEAAQYVGLSAEELDYVFGNTEEIEG